MIFINPPDNDALERRIARRGDVDASNVQARIELAKHEMEQADRFDYQVTNHEWRLDETVDEILGIIRYETSWT